MLSPKGFKKRGGHFTEARVVLRKTVKKVETSRTEQKPEGITTLRLRGRHKGRKCCPRNQQFLELAGGAGGQQLWQWRRWPVLELRPWDREKAQPLTTLPRPRFPHWRSLDKANWNPASKSARVVLSAAVSISGTEQGGEVEDGSGNGKQ